VSGVLEVLVEAVAAAEAAAEAAVAGHRLEADLVVRVRVVTVARSVGAAVVTVGVAGAAEVERVAVVPRAVDGVARIAANSMFWRNVERSCIADCQLRFYVLLIYAATDIVMIKAHKNCNCSSGPHEVAADVRVCCTVRSDFLLRLVTHFLK
jgi:hypothetical protein